MSTSSKLNLLVAYPYMKGGVIDILKQNQHQVRFLLDSGAFTAWKAGKPIALDDYCRFIESLPFEPWRYFTLDVIGDPAASMKNYETMLKRGFRPVPIFTRGEDPSVLDDYYKTSDVVGIGGLVGTGGNKGFINGIMRHVNGRKVHWLGFTSVDYLKHYRPYMCDSSSWSASTRYGSLPLYIGSGRFKIVKKKDFMPAPSSGIIDLIAKHGIDRTALSNKEHWINSGDDKAIQLVGVRSWLMYAADVEKNISTKLFLAGAGIKDVQWFIDNFNWNQKRLK